MWQKRRLISLCIILFYCFSIVSPCFSIQKKSGYLRIIKTSPVADSTVGSVKGISVKFNLPVDMETVNLFTFVVKESGNKNPIFGKIRSGGSRTVTFIPRNPLASGKKYYVTLYPDIKTRGGLTLVKKSSFSFMLIHGGKPVVAKLDSKFVKSAVKKVEPELKKSKKRILKKKIVEKQEIKKVPAREIAAKKSISSVILVTDCNIRGKKLASNSTIIMTFNKLLDKKTMKSKIMLWNEDKKEQKIRIHYMKSLNKLIVKSATDLSVGKEYAFIVEKGLKSTDGSLLPDDEIYVFKSMPISDSKNLSNLIGKIQKKKHEPIKKIAKVVKKAEPKKEIVKVVKRLESIKEPVKVVKKHEPKKKVAVTSEKEKQEALSAMLAEITAEEEKKKLRKNILKREQNAIKAQKHRQKLQKLLKEKEGKRLLRLASEKAEKEKLLALQKKLADEKKLAQQKKLADEKKLAEQKKLADIEIQKAKQIELEKKTLAVKSVVKKVNKTAYNNEEMRRKILAEIKKGKQKKVENAELKMQLQLELEKEKVMKVAKATKSVKSLTKDQKKQSEVREKLKVLLDRFKEKPVKKTVKTSTRVVKTQSNRKKEIESLKKLLTKLDKKEDGAKPHKIMTPVEKKPVIIASKPKPEKSSREINTLLNELEKSEQSKTASKKGELVSELLNELENEKEILDLKKAEEDRKNKLLKLELEKARQHAKEVPVKNLSDMVQEIEEAKDLVVIRSNPDSGSVIYDVKKPIEIFFSTSVDEKSLNPFSVKLKRENKNMICKMKYFPSRRKLTIKPVELLQQGDLYTVILTADVLSLTGKRLRKKEISFRIREADDIEGPEILDTYPRFGEENASVNTKIEVFFSEAINRRSLNVFSFTLFRDKKPVYGSVIYKKDDQKAIFIPETRLKSNRKYTAYIDKSIVDVRRNQMKSSFVWSFKTAKKPDKIPPYVVRKTPVSAEEKVPVTVKLDIEFSESLSRSTITPFSITLNDGIKNILCKYVVSQGGKKISVIPLKRLKFDTTYKAKVQNVSDIDGNIMTTTHAWLFRTAYKPDTNPPVILDTTPKNNAVEVSVYSSINVKFSEPLNPIPINLKQFRLLSGRNELDIKIQYNKLEKSVQIIPVKGLEYGNDYTVLVKDGVIDLTGNKLQKSYKWSFRTSDREDLTPPSILAVYPEIGSEDIDTGVELSIVFDEPLDPRSLDEETIFLKDMKKSKVKMDLKYDEKLKTVVLKPKKALQNSLTYTVFVTTQVRDTAGNRIKNGVRWSFRTKSDKHDYRAPAILSVSPVVDAKFVDPRSEISITFNEKLKPETVNLFNFQLKSGTHKEDVNLFYDDFLEIVVMKLKYPLAEGKKYTVTVNPGVADKSSNIFGKKFSWSFTTMSSTDKKIEEKNNEVPNVINKYSLMVSTSVPAQDEVGVPVDSDIRVFVNNPLDTTRLNGESLFMIDEIGRAVQVKFSFNTAQNRLLVRPLKKLSPNLGYSLFLVKELIRDIYGNQFDEDYILNFKTFKVGNSGRIRLLSEEMGIPQKIARKKLVAQKDIEAPKPIKISPSNGTTDVSVSPKISIVFSEYLNPVTVNENTIKVDDGMELVSGRVSYDNATKKVVFIPSMPLLQGKTYRVTLGKHFQDMSGNHLEKEYVYTFTTRDNSGPMVKSTVPLDGTKDYSVTAPLQAEFSKSVLKITLNPFTVKLFEQNSQLRVKGYIKYSPADSRLMFIPDRALKKGIEYTFRVSEGIQDTSGNFMKTSIDINFATEK